MINKLKKLNLWFIVEMLSNIVFFVFSVASFILCIPIWLFSPKPHPVNGKEWSRWFAWYPVYDDNTKKFYWLTTIERRRKYTTNPLYDDLEFRKIKK